MGFKEGLKYNNAKTKKSFSSQIWDLKLTIEELRQKELFVLAAKYGI